MNLPGWVYLILFIIYITLDKLHLLDKGIERYHKWKASYSIRSDKKYIARNIQHQVNQAVQKMQMDTLGILSYSLRVKWMIDDPEEISDTFVKKDMVIIKMRKEKNQNKNITNTVGEYVRQVLLSKIRWALSNESRII